MRLSDRVHEAECDHTGRLPDVLIRDCILSRTDDALSCLTLMAKADFDFGMSMNRRFNAFAVMGLLWWGKAGLTQIKLLFEGDRRGTLRVIVMRLLSAVAVGEIEAFINSYGKASDFAFQRNDGAVKEICDALLESFEQLKRDSRALILDLFVGVAPEDEAAALLSASLMDASKAVARILMRSAAGWHQATSADDIEELRGAILANPNDEPVFQHFLARHPHFLDPMAQQSWDRPDFMGRQSPDFLLRRTDGSYLLVEIECPGKGLVTKGGRITAEATHAIKQVNTYREFAMQNFLVLARRFPDFSEPDCLVVIGIEAPLNTNQRNELMRENRSRHGIRLVGFDWLINRAVAIRKSLLEDSPAYARLRV